MMSQSPGVVRIVKQQIPPLNDPANKVNSCIHNYTELKDSESKLVGSMIFSIQLSLELLTYYCYYRGDNDTTQGHQVCFSLM